MARQSKQVMLVVGEASGDIHAAHLVKALTEKDQTLRFFGVAGEQLKRTDFDVLFDASDLSGMGLVELVGSVRNIWKAYRILRRAMRGGRHALSVFFCFSDFNFR